MAATSEMNCAMVSRRGAPATTMVKASVQRNRISTGACWKGIKTANPHAAPNRAAVTIINRCHFRSRAFRCSTVHCA